MLKVRYPQDLKKFENYDLGVSDWFLIDQKLINAFAKLSGDDQWIHIDSDRALNEMPEGKTIAHGLLTLCISPTLGKNKIHIENLKQTLNYGIDNASSSGEVSVHNISGRFLMEKEVGDRLDLRAGLGMGLTLIEKKFLSESFDGSGFSYDLLLGFSIRVMENWSILVDYRYFITAAHKNYDRLQSHLFELSANFDI